MEFFTPLNLILLVAKLTKAYVVSHAIKNEEEAYAFYKKAADSVSHQSVKKLLMKLANEELKHKEVLQQYGVGSTQEISSDIGWLNIIDDLNTRNSESLKQVDNILKFAMDRERKTEQKYLQFAEKVEELEVKELCLGISNAETGHYNRLKSEYNRLNTY